MDEKSREPLQAILDKDLSCYVLIACGEPSTEGEIQVEMTYHGKPHVASYLLQQAQDFIENEDSDSAQFKPLELVKS